MSATLLQFEPPLMLDVVRQTLLRHLEMLPVGHRLPPINDLARQLSVGQSNLREAIRLLARQGVLYSKPKVGTFLTQPVRTDAISRIALPVPSLTGQTIQIACFNSPDPAIETIVRAAVDELESRGATVVRDHYSLNDPNNYVSRGCDLAMLINPSGRLNLSSLPSIPTVIASTSWHARTSGRWSWDLVGVDQVVGGAIAGEALRRAGCQEVVFLGRRLEADNDSPYDMISQLRLQGLESGWGQPVPPKHQLDGEGYSVQGGARAFRRWAALPHRPTGIFAVSDDVAMGFYAAAVGHGLRARVDFHLVGFDGLAMGQSQPEPLTTVQLPFDDMGRTAAELAASRLQDPHRPPQATYLGCRLLRGHTAAFIS